MGAPLYFFMGEGKKMLMDDNVKSCKNTNHWRLQVLQHNFTLSISMFWYKHTNAIPPHTLASFCVNFCSNKTFPLQITAAHPRHRQLIPFPTLRRHLYLLRLIDSPLCRACGVKEETSAHILCECEALASLRHTYLGSFFLEPEDIKSMSLGAVCSYGRATRLLWFWYGAQRARLKGLGASGPWGPVPTCNQSIPFPSTTHNIKPPGKYLHFEQKVNFSQ